MTFSLAQLQVRRAREHRLESSAPLRDVDEVVRFVETVGVVMASGKSSLPTLTEAIVGHTINGSWMVGPEGQTIYDLWTEADRTGLRSAPLVQGKRVYLRGDLAPALAAIAADPARLARAVDGLKPVERRLYDAVRDSGEVRVDEWTQISGLTTSQVRTARTRLAALFLVTSEELHTDRGYHTVILTPAKHAKPTRRFAAATREVLLAAIRACVLADAKEVRKWNDWSSEALDALLDDGQVVAIDRFVVCSEL